MKLIIEIDAENDAFQPDRQGDEFRFIFNQVMARLPMFPRDAAWPLRDSNGNMVGEVRAEEDS